tara:strand:+ start:12573 stop:12752 length:180 start_codon:yes stop_codon:yes gene_type:complete
MEKKLGAIAIITGMLIPWMLAISLKVFGHDLDIAVAKEQYKTIIEKLDDLKHGLNQLGK